MGVESGSSYHGASWLRYHGNWNIGECDSVSCRNVWSSILLEVLSVSSREVDKTVLSSQQFIRTSEKEVDRSIFVHLGWP